MPVGQELKDHFRYPQQNYLEGVFKQHLKRIVFFFEDFLSNKILIDTPNSHNNNFKGLFHLFKLGSIVEIERNIRKENELFLEEHFERLHLIRLRIEDILLESGPHLIEKDLILGFYLQKVKFLWVVVFGKCAENVELEEKDFFAVEEEVGETQQLGLDLVRVTKRVHHLPIPREVPVAFVQIILKI